MIFRTFTFELLSNVISVDFCKLVSYEKVLLDRFVLDYSFDVRSVVDFSCLTS